MRPTPLMRAGLGLTTAIAILSATVLPAAAATSAPQSPATAVKSVEATKNATTVGWLTAEERKALAPYVSYDGNAYRLDAKAAKAAGVAQQAIDTTTTAVSRLNALLGKGVAVGKDAEGVTVDPAKAQAKADKSSGIALRGAAAPETQIVEGITVKVTWFGLLIHLDSFVTGKVQAGVDITKDIVQVASSVIAIASLGSLLPAATLAAAVADLSAKVVSFCTTRKGELYVYITWAGVPVCNPFA
ncbi:hypothetical protein [Streptomyces sp. UNOC14_S4]|uniref:hypothetical protein n=1 Tax=Streptomyces sp. UNOC14_S4 TaxID=2872340 RepID=UPI001E5D82F8|nr:hypothetical protein [Streptomyces sp. UNOC14_S4]MCC3771156.1 hypothetical protein [Streptomyces sp. UNOC14_S4]